MQFLTQTELNPGNCWQTALACILGVPAESLPPQAEIEGWHWGRSRASYWNILQHYLRAHHRLVYSEVHAHEFACVRPRRPEWLLIGETLRTGKFMLDKEARHVMHCIVTYEGGAHTWDVHPSRDGLTSVERWGVLGDVQATTLRYHEERLRRAQPLLDDEQSVDFLDHWCLCPAHKLEEARRRVARLQELNSGAKT